MDDNKDGGVISRQESAKLHDDSELIEGQETGLSGAHALGGNLQRDIGTQDELEQVTGDAGRTRVTKERKVQPPTGTRSDFEGDQSESNLGIGNTSI